MKISGLGAEDLPAQSTRKAPLLTYRLAMCAPVKAIDAPSAGTASLKSRPCRRRQCSYPRRARSLGRVRLVVRTQPSQGWCTGSTPVRGAKLNYILASPEKALYGLVTGG